MRVPSVIQIGTHPLRDLRAARGAALHLLGARDAPIRRAIETILALALRLRVQLDSLPDVGAQAHAASAMRWRAELRECVRFVLDALRAAGEKESRRELLDLCRLLSYNDYYEREGSINMQ